MRVIAGIDEAGYGPKFGPLTAGRCVLAYEGDTDDTGDAEAIPDIWSLLDEAVCRKPRDNAKRIAVADSKKLTVSGKHGHAAVPHLERAVLAFLALHTSNAGLPATADDLLFTLGSHHHERDDLPPWYAPSDEHAWCVLPAATSTVAGRNGHDEASLTLDAGLLRRAARHAGVAAPGAAEPCLGVAVLCEDAYNAKLAHSKSKADVSFALIAHHLRHVWNGCGHLNPWVIVDRQGGRTRYTDNLAWAIPGSSVRIIEEHAAASAYELTSPDSRRMFVRFMPKADDLHLPVALASMTAKYVREIYMHRFQRWFAERLPAIKPTAGYGADAKRFAAEITPHLAELSILQDRLIRRA